MKKRMLALVFFFLALFYLASCGSGKNLPKKVEETTTAPEETDERYSIYLLAQSSGYTGTYEEWLESISGREIVLSISANNELVWKYSSEPDSSYRVLFNLSLIQGAKGDSGKSAYEIYKQYNPNYTGTEEEWINSLVAGNNQTMPEITIGDNGNWYINGVDTGKSSRGTPGTSGSVITIGSNDHWFIDGTDTGVLARGTNGENGNIVTIGQNGHWYIDGEDTNVLAQGSVSTITIGDNGNWYIDGADTGKSSKGTNGANGTVVTIGSNNHWYLDGVDTGILALGQNGTNGTVVTIGTNGNWYIDNVDSGVVARGSVSTIEIGDNGNWFIDGVDTGKSSKGQDGTNGTNGKNGTVVTIGSNNHWYLDGVDTGILALGQNGTNGTTPEITIGDNGNWWINGQDTGKSSRGANGANGTTPEITIGDNGNWWINGVDTGKPSRGEKGDVGTAPEITIGDNGNWFVDGVDTGKSSRGANGEAGTTPEITIGDNGNWFVDGVDTGKPSRGEKGDAGTAPVITIGPNGNWFIDSADTGQKAQGENGASAFEIYLEYHPDYEGTEEDWLASLQGTTLVKYRVTFDSNGGSAVAEQLIVEGKTATKPDNPTKDGFVFEYWQDSNENEFDFATAINDSIVLTARWISLDDFETTWRYDEEGHWHKHTTLDITSNYATHTFEFSYDSENNKDEYTCSVCGYSYSVNHTNHSFTGGYGYNETDHYIVCIYCNCPSEDKSEHSFSFIYDSINNKDVYTCSVCSYSYNVNHENHKYENSYKVDENNHYLTCIYCEEAAVAGNSHTYGYVYYDEQTGKDYSYCTVCGYRKDMEHTHILGDLTYDSTGHWQECSVCGYKTTVLDHEFEFLNYAENGDACECSVCGYIDILIHSHHTYDNYTYQRDEEGHWKVCMICGGAPTAKVDHTFTFLCYDYDSGKDIYVCVCEYESIEDHTHRYQNSRYDYTPLEHWIICDDCGGGALEKSSHTMMYWTENEISYEGCTVCGYRAEVEICNHEYNGTYIYDALGHTAVCSICHEATGVKENHTLEYYSYNKSTNKDIYKCQICEYQEEVDHTHQFTEYGYNEEVHWLVCEICQEVGENLSHDLKYVSLAEEAHDGYYARANYECVCGYSAQLPVEPDYIEYSFNQFGDVSARYNTGNYGSVDINGIDFEFYRAIGGDYLTLLDHDFNYYDSLAIGGSINTTEALYGIGKISITYQSSSPLIVEYSRDLATFASPLEDLGIYAYKMVPASLTTTTYIVDLEADRDFFNFFKICTTESDAYIYDITIFYTGNENEYYEGYTYSYSDWDAVAPTQIFDLVPGVTTGTIAGKTYTYYNYEYVSANEASLAYAALVDPVDVSNYYLLFRQVPVNYFFSNEINDDIRNLFKDKLRLVSVYTRTDGYVNALDLNYTYFDGNNSSPLYYELDIDLDDSYSTSNRGVGRVVIFLTGVSSYMSWDPVCVYTDDHYATFMEYDNNGSFSHRFDAERKVTGVRYSGFTQKINNEPNVRVKIYGFGNEIIADTDINYSYFLQISAIPVTQLQGNEFLGWYLDSNFTTLAPDYMWLYSDTNIYARYANNEITELTTTEAIAHINEVIDAGNASGDDGLYYYVKGIITDTALIGKDGNSAYFTLDNCFVAYYVSLNGKNLPITGDEVTIYGNMLLYTNQNGSTYELKGTLVRNNDGRIVTARIKELESLGLSVSQNRTKPQEFTVMVPIYEFTLGYTVELLVNGVVVKQYVISQEDTIGHKLYLFTYDALEDTFEKEEINNYELLVTYTLYENWYDSIDVRYAPEYKDDLGVYQDYVYLRNDVTHIAIYKEGFGYILDYTDDVLTSGAYYINYDPLTNEIELVFNTSATEIASEYIVKTEGMTDTNNRLANYISALYFQEIFVNENDELTLYNYSDNFDLEGYTYWDIFESTGVMLYYNVSDNVIVVIIKNFLYVLPLTRYQENNNVVNPDEAITSITITTNTTYFADYTVGVYAWVDDFNTGWLTVTNNSNNSISCDVAGYTGFLLAFFDKDLTIDWTNVSDSDAVFQTENYTITGQAEYSFNVYTADEIIAMIDANIEKGINNGNDGNKYYVTGTISNVTAGNEGRYKYSFGDFVIFYAAPLNSNVAALENGKQAIVYSEVLLYVKGTTRTYETASNQGITIYVF